jgi:hypothetical protein
MVVFITSIIYKIGVAFDEAFFFRKIVDIGKKFPYLCRPFGKYHF